MAEQTCLVCGKTFGEEQGLKWNHAGQWLMFDDMGCRNRFIGNPQKYLEQQPA